MFQAKPFNPILGETFQAKLGEDSTLYIEQTSHHPPILNFLLLNPNFKYYGYEKPVVSTGPNNVVAKSIGNCTIEFKDGSSFRTTNPEINVTGTILGDRTYSIKGKIVVEDLKNDYVGIIEFNPDERGFLNKMFSKKQTFPDYYKGFITRKSQCDLKKEDEKTKLFNYIPKGNFTKFLEVSGNWTTNFDCDDTTLWDRKSSKYSKLLRCKYTLPSDCTLRSDLVNLRNNNKEKSQEEKIKLEEIQRNDRKLRVKYGGAKSH